MFDLILIKDKKTEIYSAENNLIEIILTNTNLWKSNINDFYMFLKNKNLKFKEINDLKEKVIIDFDNKICEQHLSKDFFDGFYIPTMFFETKKLKESQYYLNALYENLKHNTIKKEIHFYYIKNDNVIDDVLNFNKFDFENIKDFIKNYRIFERNPKRLINFGFCVDDFMILKDFTFADISEIFLVKIPLNPIN